MESVYHIKTRKYFNVSDDDFDKFQHIFGSADTRSEEDAISEIEISEETFSSGYTADEIKSIFWLHAEYTGLDKEIAKNKIADSSDRRKAEDELKVYINSSKKNRKPLSIKSAKAILKVLEAFDSVECELDANLHDD